MNKPADRPVHEMTFEEAMSELESVVAQLEQGKVALEDSIRLYERGSQLKVHCQEKLKAAEEKVRMITLGDDRNAVGTEPLDPD